MTDSATEALPVGDGVNKNVKENNPLEEQQPSTRSVPVPHFDSTTTVNSDSGLERSVWSRKLDFFLSCVGYAVGLGNIWRFPYLCYISGGGAFLIPYFFFLVVCGVPLFFLEMSLGQFGSRGPITIWKISPIFKGLGLGMAIVSGVACVYYNVIIAWAIYYIYHSMVYTLAWSSCDNAWNTPTCISRSNRLEGMSSFNASEILHGTFSEGNVTKFTNVSDLMLNHSGKTSSEEFWLYNVLQQSSGIETAGNIQWPLVLTLFIAWVLVFLCVSKGIKSSGKVVYVTAIFPYIVLISLLGRAVTLPGAWTGISYYLTPKWDKLLSFEVWGLAATQIFYSVGAGWGALISMSSYNKFNNNVYRDSMIVPVINCSTSLLAGLVIFSVIGYMAHETGKSVEDVVEQGIGLAFIVYPEALAMLPFAPFWSFMFFLMLLSVGLDTQFGMFETTVSAFIDEYPQYLKKRKTTFTAALCFILFLCGLPCVTQGGSYVVQLMDYYSAAFSLMVISLLETIAIAWVYGIDRFCLDISLMTKKFPSIWWKLCWCYITPLTIIALLIFIITTHVPITYNDYVYPSWSIGLGWVIAMCSIAPIPIYAAINVYKTSGTLKERIFKNLKPTPDWGPVIEENKLLYDKSLASIPSKFKQSVEDSADATVLEGELNQMIPVCDDRVDAL